MLTFLGKTLNLVVVVVRVKGEKRNEGMAKGRTRSSGRGVGNASFCFRKLERFIVMLIWASTLQRAFRVFVKVHAKIHFERVLHSWRETHFWCFPQVSSRDLSRPGNGIPLVSIVSIFIERRHRYPRKILLFLQNFVTRAVTLRFDRSSSLENPLLPPEISSFRNSKYIVFHDERISNCRSNMSSSFFFPICIFLFRVTIQRENSAAGNISLSNPWWLAAESNLKNRAHVTVHFRD